jgi:RNA polymerase sigma factor (sigma-70 family)
MEDLIQEGRVAICEHCRDFNPKYGEFSTFIVPYIKDAIKSFICKINNTTPYYSGQSKKMEKAAEELRKEGNLRPNFNDLSKKMGIGASAVERVYMETCGQNPISVEDLNDYNDDYTNDPGYIAEQQEQMDSLKKAISQLSDEERMIIQIAFFNSDKEISFAEIAKLTGLPPKVCRRIKNNALNKLKHSAELRKHDFAESRIQKEARKFKTDFVFNSPTTVNVNINIALHFDGGDNDPDFPIYEDSKKKAAL